MVDREKVIKGLECCSQSDNYSGKPCKECPYNHEWRDDQGIVHLCKITQLRKDALFLLQAQGPRVMTWEELSALPFDTPVFIEENNDECGWNVFCDIDEENDVRFCGFKASADYYDLEEYGESWRCWTSRPTDEQREAVKWE